MTSLYLLLWIATGILLQIAVYLGVGFWHHWQGYQALRNVAAEFDLAVTPEASSAVQQITAAAWSGFRTFRVERKVLEDVTGQVCSFYLVPEDGQPLASFLPGQFLTFRLDIASPKGDTDAVIRCYSLSDAPQQNTYRVSIKRAPAPQGSQAAPGVSSNYFHDHVKTGSLLQVRVPSGHFYIDRSDAPVVLIGGGIGITPMLSMLNWCLTEQPGREVWLFYGVRSSPELVMPSHLQALAKAHSNFHLHLCFSDPLAADLVDDPARHGHPHHSRVDVALLRRLLPLKPYHFYICGPTPMLASLVPALEDWGVPDGRIHFEAFGPASVKRKKSTGVPAAAMPGNSDAVLVTFAKSGKQRPWQPAMGSLLDFAEANGIAVDSGCRAGGCGSCQTSIRMGEVAYTQSPDFDPEPGSCLLCVCTPKTAVTLEV
ncbi:MAG: 2Fe-2S iron-sulfur cluster-binding protein [Rhodoferax sp.]